MNGIAKSTFAEIVDNDEQLHAMNSLLSMHMGTENEQLIRRHIWERRRVLVQAYLTVPQPMMTTVANAIHCECGAKHTSNPSYHLNYCPMR